MTGAISPPPRLPSCSAHALYLPFISTDMSLYTYSPVAKGINKGVSKESNLQEYNKEVNPPLSLWDTMFSGLFMSQNFVWMRGLAHISRFLDSYKQLPSTWRESQKQGTLKAKNGARFGAVRPRLRLALLSIKYRELSSIVRQISK